jgi:hypothetical protein
VVLLSSNFRSIIALFLMFPKINGSSETEINFGIAAC